MDLRLAWAWLALVYASGCADTGGGTASRARGLDGTLDEARDHELDVVRASVLPYLRLDLVSPEVLPDSASPAANNEYLRALCSLALASSVLRHHDEDPPIARDEAAWLAEAAARFGVATSTTADTWWLAASPGLDCLLAASASDTASTETRDKIAALAADLASRMVADERFDPAWWRSRAGAKDNSPAEEVGIAASFLAAAAELVGHRVSSEEVDGWLARSEALIAYSTERGDGAPFPADRWLVTNHGMSPHAVYTQSLLTSFGEIRAIDAQTDGAMPAGLAPDPAATRAIGDAIDAALDGDFHLTGAFEHIGSDGAPIAGDGFDHAYERMTRVLAHHPPGSQLLIPTTDVGTMSQIIGSDGMLHTYQLRGDRIWKYTCKDGRCDAIFAHPIERQWTFITGSFDVPLPTRDVDALAQFWAGERIETYVYQGNRVWRYDCESGTCRPEWTRPFAEQVPADARDEWNGVPPPERVDAANHLYDPETGIVRMYWYSGDRVWASICEGGACRAFFTKPILEQWDWVEGRDRYAIDLPPRDVDAITQYYDASHTLVTYIYQDDRVWKYLCAGGRCDAQFTRTLLEQFAPIRSQDRWAVDVVDRQTGVCDWGFDATIQNSAYAFLALQDGDGANLARYSELRAEQIERKLHERPYFAPSAEGGTFSPDAPLAQSDFERITPRAIRPLAGEWRDHFATDRPAWTTLDDQLYTHFWLNVLAAYNATIAYLALADPGYLTPL